MSTVISVRIPKKLKRRLDSIPHVNWSEEIRRFLEERVAEYEAELLRQRVREHLRKVPEMPKGATARWIRNDRDGH